MAKPLNTFRSQVAEYSIRIDAQAGTSPLCANSPKVWQSPPVLQGEKHMKSRTAKPLATPGTGDLKLVDSKRPNVNQLPDSQN